MSQPGRLRLAVVLASSFLSQVLTSSVLYTVGVYYIALTEKYPDFTEVIPWIGSMYVGTFALGAPLAGVVTNVFSCRACVITSGLLGLVGLTCSSVVTDVRYLFLTLSLVTGLSSSFSYSGSLSILGFYFPQHTAVACGVAVTGTGFGLFVHPSLARYLIDTFGVSGAFLITGAIASHSVPLGLLMRPSINEREHIKNVGGRNAVLKNILCGSCLNSKDVVKDPTFSFFVASMLFFGLAYSATLTYMPDYFKFRGATFEQAAFSVSMQGIGNVVCRVITGLAANDEKIGGGLLCAGFLTIMSVISWFIDLFANSIGGMYAYGFLLGIYTGGISALLSIRTFEIVGVRRFAHSFGLVLFIFGLGLLFGPPMAGFIYKVTKVFTDGFVCVSCMFTAATSFAFISTMCSGRTTTPDDTRDTVETIPDENSPAESDTRLKLLTTETD